MISQIAQASLQTEILIDFECYVDTEVGLIRLINDKYRDGNVFNIDKLNDIRQIILSLIDRKDINPLSIISKDNVSEDDLLDYYIEFMTEEYDEILKRSVTTELKTLINLLKSEPSINVTFLCETEIEEELLRKDRDLDRCKILVKERDEINFSNYFTFIFKYITNYIDTLVLPYKTYYFSRYRVNFDEQFNLNYPDIVDKIIYTGGSIEIIDLYNKSYLEGENDNENI